MTTEWDNTPWAGSPAETKALIGQVIVPRGAGLKAVTSLGPWATGTPLSSFSDTPQRRAEVGLKAYKVGWFNKAGRKIAGDVATLDWSVSEGDMEEGEDETTLDRPDLSLPFDSLKPIDQLMRLLERPNPAYTGRQLMHKTQVRLDFAGAACWYLAGGDSGLPTAIYGISPTRMWESRNATGEIIGWVMDKDSPSGGVPFSKDEILWFSTGNATDDEVWGVSAVEAVYSQVPLTDQMARHTSTVLSTGGRLAGMMWPKDRALSEDEFVDAQRAWRNVASDPEAGKRLLIFPEPMEYAAGASTPAEIGIPELAILTRDEILTAFPVSPYRLGVPAPGGLNSGEVRREDRRDYWEETIHPRADLIEEVIQVGLLSRYEKIMGRTYDYEIAEPNLDDAPSLLEKVAALRALASAGFEEKESVKAVGLGHIKFSGIPAPDPTLVVSVGDSSRADAAQTTSSVIKPVTAAPTPTAGKAIKAREDVAAAHTRDLSAFLAAQRDRAIEAIRAAYPAVKSERLTWTKADPEWWNAAAEDAALREVVARLYVDAGRGALQVVADGLGRIVPNKAVQNIVDDLLTYGGERIVDINARTLQSITLELAEGTRRGYGISQLIDGVPAEGFRGILNVGLDNGVGVWGDLRAETISRTETALSYNRAALRGYGEFQVQRVIAYDGDGDDQCAARNGNEYTLNEALGIADHPNGTLDWGPVTDKSWSDDRSNSVALKALDLLSKAIGERDPALAPVVNINNTTPEVKVPPAIFYAGDTHVAAPIVNLPEQAAITVEAPIVNVVAEREPPVFHIHNQAPVNNVPPAVVYAGDTHVSTPEIKVYVPEQRPPDITVDAPVVNVTTPETVVNVTVPEGKPTKRTIRRNAQGAITSIDEEPA